MNAQRILHGIDRLSNWSGKLFAWLIVILALVVGVEVFKRYILNAPTAWIFDLNSMLYGTALHDVRRLCAWRRTRMCAAISSTGRCGRRVQAGLDLALYFLFFIPGILALVYAGYGFAELSWRIDEHSNVTADGPPVYQFKAVIPIAGALVMLQGLAEIVRCVVCLQTGRWPQRMKDVEEIDVVGEQLAHSEFVDEESRREAMEKAHDIQLAAQQRGMGETMAVEDVARDADKPKKGGRP